MPALAGGDEAERDTWFALLRADADGHPDPQIVIPDLIREPPHPVIPALSQ